jgi:hypothetical protein
MPSPYHSCFQGVLFHCDAHAEFSSLDQSSARLAGTSNCAYAALLFFQRGIHGGIAGRLPITSFVGIEQVPNCLEYVSSIIPILFVQLT